MSRMYDRLTPMNPKHIARTLTFVVPIVALFILAVCVESFTMPIVGGSIAIAATVVTVILLLVWGAFLEWAFGKSSHSFSAILSSTFGSFKKSINP